MKYVYLPNKRQAHVFLFRMRHSSHETWAASYGEVLAWVSQEIPAGTWTAANMTFRLEDDASAMAMRLRWC
jgi:hypothetical protein